MLLEGWKVLVMMAERQSGVSLEWYWYHVMNRCLEKRYYCVVFMFSFIFQWFFFSVIITIISHVE